jgi:hypothetical protein
MPGRFAFAFRHALAEFRTIPKLGLGSNIGQFDFVIPAEGEIQPEHPKEKEPQRLYCQGKIRVDPVFVVWNERFIIGNDKSKRWRLFFRLEHMKFEASKTPGNVIIHVI